MYVSLVMPKSMFCADTSIIPFVLIAPHNSIHQTTPERIRRYKSICNFVYRYFTGVLWCIELCMR